MTKPAIELTDLTFSYGQAAVLAAVTLTIPAGDFVCLVGPNGGGKTTFLKILLGLLKPTRGIVRVFGQAPDSPATRSRVGYMPQSSRIDLDFPATVQEITLMGRAGGGGLRYRKADHAAATRALTEAGVAHLAARSFGELSGGERQRVLIARAIVDDPTILLLDEPTANVDAAAEEQLYSLLREFNQRMTIVLVSHDIGFVFSTVKSVICVNQGQVHLHPTSEMTGETIRELYGTDIRLIRHDHRCAEAQP